MCRCDLFNEITQIQHIYMDYCGATGSRDGTGSLGHGSVVTGSTYVAGSGQVKGQYIRIFVVGICAVVNGTFSLVPLAETLNFYQTDRVGSKTSGSGRGSGDSGQGSKV